MNLSRLLSTLGVLLFATAAHAQLVTVPNVEPSQYLGTWYQIAANPMPFDTGCVCSRQELGARTNGLISVFNSCNDQTPTGPLRAVVGIATNLDPTSNAKYSVDFGLPDKGDYWIIGLDPAYRWAVVSEPSKRALFILSKTTNLEPDLYDEAIKAVAVQVDTSQLVTTLQAGCSYPLSATKAK